MHHVHTARTKRRQQPAHMHVQGPRPCSICACALERAPERQRSTVDHCHIYDTGIGAPAFGANAPARAERAHTHGCAAHAHLARMRSRLHQRPTRGSALSHACMCTARPRTRE
eukprot:2753210-Alexandrium_andersonii.AAC.1